MDTLKASQLRKNMEESIAKIFENFTEQTGLSIESVYVSSSHVEHVGSSQKIRRGYRIEIEALLR